MKKTIIITLAIITSFSLQARAVFYKEINCQTNRMAKGIKVTPDTVNFFERDFKRELASVPSREQAMTQGSVTRSFNFEGHKYTLHVENVESFSDVEDYLTISDQKGHEILYPVTCSKI